jgi:hypothetical protein
MGKNWKRYMIEPNKESCLDHPVQDVKARLETTLTAEQRWPA